MRLVERPKWENGFATGRLKDLIFGVKMKIANLPLSLLLSLIIFYMYIYVYIKRMKVYYEPVGEDR